MPKTRPVQQQRKRRVRMSKEAPFPIPIAMVTGETASNSQWIYYTATLQDSGIMVHHSGDMDFLYRMGFFGKGSMSRGQPQWVESQRVATLPCPAPHSGGWQGVFQVRVASRRRYMTHLQWHLQSAGDISTLTDAQQDVCLVQSHAPTHSEGTMHMEEEETQTLHHAADEQMPSTHTDWDEKQTHTDLDEKHTHTKHTDWDEKPTHTSQYDWAEKQTHTTRTDWDEGEGDADFWGTQEDGDNTLVSEKTKDKQLASWDDTEGEAEFGGSESTSDKPRWSGCGQNDASPCIQSSGDRTDNSASGHVPSSEPNPVDVGPPSSEPNPVDVGPPSSQQNPVDVCDPSSGCHGPHIRASQHSPSTLGHDSASQTPVSVSFPTGTSERETGSPVFHQPPVDHDTEKPSATHSTRQSQTCHPVLHKSSVDQGAEEPSVTHSVNKTDHTDACVGTKTEMCGDTGGEVCADTGDVNTAGEVCPDTGDVNTAGEVRADSAGNEADRGVEWSAFCGDDDNLVHSRHGRLLFVIPDSDEETQTPEGRVWRTKTRWKPVVKQDPFPVTEHLALSCEEAFFLAYGLGCLTVLDPQKGPMDVARLWRACCERRPDFVPCYVAYHHYRAHNWVPKTGLKFGCSFLLYKDGPPFYHGSYSVVVRFLDAEGTAVEGFGEQRQFSWTSLAALKRITEHVGKELMICYVIKPRDLTPEDMLSPACIPRFQVKEVLVSRWVSSQERESKELEDLP